MAKILIAGCGYVGSALAAELVMEGHDVWGLRRRPLSLPLGVRPIAADLGDPSALKDLPGRLDAVVYLVSAGGADDPHYRSAYVEGPRILLEALDAQMPAPGRFLFVSSTAVYAQDHGEWVDETSPTEPTHFSGRRLLEGEQLVLAGPIRPVVVRLAGIYGPRRTRLIEQVRSGTATYRRRPEQWTNRIHRDDCAGVLKHLLFLERPERLYLGVDCEPASQRAVMEWIAGALGAPTPRAVSAADSGVRRSRGNKRCSNRRLLESGYVFRFPTYREGYRQVLEEMR